MGFFVNRFKQGKWLSRSNSLLSDKSKVMALLASLTGYMKKGGLAKVKEDLSLLAAYVGDIVHGRYKDYSRSSLTLAVAAVLYVVSPLDLLPDLLPVGFIDDVAIVTWALSRLTDEMTHYRNWRTTSQQTEISSNNATK